MVDGRSSKGNGAGGMRVSEAESLMQEALPLPRHQLQPSTTNRPENESN
ncbi:hypothetical protein Hsw_1959 [Hymenobacter swuensis DY53]|uniref:Uncharacterized protein n=1 Tax=Hymenobacter swuensis DY53 TaxID=1227739 RepID=W8EWV7_9BACT|nr:hypothetical protein Hsw_1959 [Hymenobacter swuensis DY53]